MIAKTNPWNYYFWNNLCHLSFHFLMNYVFPTFLWGLLCSALVVCLRTPPQAWLAHSMLCVYGTQWAQTWCASWGEIIFVIVTKNSTRTFSLQWCCHWFVPVCKRTCKGVCFVKILFCFFYKVNCAKIITEFILERAGPIIFKTFLLELIAFRLLPVTSPARGARPENYWKR